MRFDSTRYRTSKSQTIKKNPSLLLALSISLTQKHKLIKSNRINKQVKKHQN